jgi:hypothetical protein
MRHPLFVPGDGASRPSKIPIRKFGVWGTRAPREPNPFATEFSKGVVCDVRLTR